MSDEVWTGLLIYTLIVGLIVLLGVVRFPS